MTPSEGGLDLTALGAALDATTLSQAGAEGVVMPTGAPAVSSSLPFDREEIVIDEETGLECLESSFFFLSVADGPAPGQEVVDLDGDSAMDAETRQIEEDMIRNDIRERKLAETKKRHEERTRAINQEAENCMGFKLSGRGHLLVTPHDLLTDLQMDPGQFAVPNPFWIKDDPPIPFYNARYVPHWCLTGPAEQGIYKDTENQVDRRTLFKLYMAYSDAWRIARANIFDPCKHLYRQRSNYPRYLIEKEKKQQPHHHQQQQHRTTGRVQRPEPQSKTVGGTAVTFSNPAFSSLLRPRGGKVNPYMQLRFVKADGTTPQPDHPAGTPPPPHLQQQRPAFRAPVRPAQRSASPAERNARQ